jgi:hypothetical protein
MPGAEPDVAERSYYSPSVKRAASIASNSHYGRDGDAG